MLVSLSQGFPIVIGISVYQSFKSKVVARTGIVPMSGCAALSNYCATGYRQVAQLKAFHLMFINDFTSDAPLPVDRTRLADLADTGELKFRRPRY